EVPIEEINKKANSFFAIKFIGESMYPFYMDGDIVIIEKGSNFNTGNDILLTIGKSDAIIRKCAKEPNGILIKSINPIFKTQFYNFDEMSSLPITILGKAKQIIRKI
ncbi:MAG: S24 family peptidase, partial [Oscillospiraceae bacterium]|nr:S24 family peptidase [Oscillospiraceae bacterium]